MKANELRIGNLVNTAHGIKPVYGVIGEKVYQDDNLYIHIGGVKPIPIAEEWLLWFGFEKKENGWFEIIYNVRYENDLDNLIGAHDVEISINAASNFVGICNTALKEERSISSTKNKVKYVHQLQNLFFALTGKELKIKAE